MNRMSGLVAGIAMVTSGACASGTIERRPGVVVDRRVLAISARIDSVTLATLASRDIPGAAVAVLRRDTVIHLAGYGASNLSTSAPVTPGTIFQIASLTKPFTAIAVLLLVEDGKLSLDESASRFLPQLPQRYSAITIRQLLTHTSGISPDMRRANVDEMELDEFWRRLAERPESFAPGARIEYANAGYSVLSFVVERVSGLSFAEFLRRRIFAPLQMDATGYRVPRTNDGRHAVGYDIVNGRNAEAPHVFSGWGNSGIETTAEDMARFAAAVERRQLLSREGWAQVFTPGALSSGEAAAFNFAGARSHYGLGWFLTTYRGRTLHTHGGAIAGFSSILNRFPDDGYSIVVLSNGKQGADRMGQADAIARAVAAVLGIGA